MLRRPKTRKITIVSNRRNHLGLSFPYVEQVFKIERTRENLYGGILSEETVHGVTSIEREKAGPEKIHSIMRHHWVIETSCNYVKDVTFSEDACTIKDRRGSQLLSILRNLSINSFRRLGFTNMAKAGRFFSNSSKDNTLRLAGLS